jgi:prepilin-type processing-associated H-X9-DG protein
MYGMICCRPLNIGEEFVQLVKPSKKSDFQLMSLFFLGSIVHVRCYCEGKVNALFFDGNSVLVSFGVGCRNRIKRTRRFLCNSGLRLFV